MKILDRLPIAEQHVSLNVRGVTREAEGLPDHHPCQHSRTSPTWDPRAPIIPALLDTGNNHQFLHPGSTTSLDGRESIPSLGVSGNMSEKAIAIPVASSCEHLDSSQSSRQPRSQRRRAVSAGARRGDCHLSIRRIKLSSPAPAGAQGDPEEQSEARHRRQAEARLAPFAALVRAVSRRHHEDGFSTSSMYCSRSASIRSSSRRVCFLRGRQAVRAVHVGAGEEVELDLRLGPRGPRGEAAARPVGVEDEQVARGLGQGTRWARIGSRAGPRAAGSRRPR